MSSQPAQSAAPQFNLANSQIQQAANNAGSLSAATPPQTYTFDPNAANNTAALLSRSQQLNNNAALQAYSPQAAAGKTQAINDLTGGVAGDNTFLQNAALKSGLEAAGTQGTGSQGAGTISPTSAGGVTAQKIFGSQLLNYRSQRDQQALGVANSIQPDAALNPADAISLQTQAGEQAVQNQNDWNQYLSNMRLGQISNLQNQSQQMEGEDQASLNANAEAGNANRSAAVTAGTAVATTAAMAAVIL